MSCKVPIDENGGEIVEVECADIFLPGSVFSSILRDKLSLLSLNLKVLCVLLNLPLLDCKLEGQDTLYCFSIMFTIKNWHTRNVIWISQVYSYKHAKYSTEMLNISAFSSLPYSKLPSCSQGNRKTEKQCVRCYMYGINYKEAGLGGA